MLSPEILQFVKDFIEKVGFVYDSLDVEINEMTGTHVINIQSKDSRSFIGHNGDNLKAVNYLVKRMVERKIPENTPAVSVDVNGYQEEQIQKIKTIAHMMAERTRFFKSSVEMEPMNSYERLIVHSYISSMEDLETESAGKGKERHIVIKYVRPIV